MEADFNDFGVETRRQDGAQALNNLGWQFDIVDSARGLVAEVGVRCEVRAVAGWFPLVIHLAYESAGHESFEAVVHGGEGDAGHGFAGAIKDFVDRGVIAFREQHGEDHFALGGQFLPTFAEGVLELLPVVFIEILNHSNRPISWNDSKLQVESVK